MKNILKILTIAGLVLAVTLALASCDDGKKSTPMIPAGGSKWKAPKAFADPAPAFTSLETASTALTWEAPENQPKEGEISLLQGYAVLSYKKGSDRTLGTVTVTASTTASVGIPLGETHVYELYAIYKNKLADSAPDVASFTKLNGHKEKAKFKDNKEASINYPAFGAGAITSGTDVAAPVLTYSLPAAQASWDIVGAVVLYKKRATFSDEWDASWTFASGTGIEFVTNGITTSGLTAVGAASGTTGNQLLIKIVWIWDVKEQNNITATTQFDQLSEIEDLVTSETAEYTWTKG